MRDSFYLAWLYLRRHKAASAILASSLTLIFFLPSALMLVVDDATDHFKARARSTPLLVGARGSELELVLGSLYFGEPDPAVMRMSQYERVKGLNFGKAIPLYIPARHRGSPVVGTSVDYYPLRGLRLAGGRTNEIAGECVVGSKAADFLQLTVGSKLPLSGQKSFVLADAPLMLRVVGILSSTETPDDEAVFVDLKTAWIIAGLGHGHAVGAKHGTESATEYTEITAENVSRFHFHGDSSQLPLTSVIVRPQDAKARALLLGEYLSPEDVAQIVVPSDVMDDLLAKILQVRSYLVVAIVLMSFVTLAVVVLVVMLSVKLRQREITMMKRMGCSRFAIPQLLACQILIIVVCSGVAAAVLTMAVSRFGHEVVRFVVI